MPQSRRRDRAGPDARHKPTFSDICKFLAFPKQPLQVRVVRGSPLIRFIFLAIALAATAVGLMRVTSARSTGGGPVQGVAVEKPVVAGKSVPFRLLLSAPAAEVVLDTGSVLRPAVEGSSVSGTLVLEEENPRVGLVVRWKDEPAADEHRFAKLTLEAPGEDTFSHVFDAIGDIDDLLELPLPAAK